MQKPTNQQHSTANQNNYLCKNLNQLTQELALQLLKSGHNVFLTGQAGSGKTYVINQYIKYLHNHCIDVAVTASTGIAATHIGGTTIHSWSGMGIKDDLSEGQMRTLKTRAYLKKRYKNIKVLVLDEISMLHRRQFELLDRLMRYMKDQPFTPFGGVQIVLSGDFLQLPPVSPFNEAMRDRFCFMSPSWVEAKFAICYLTTQYRQGNNELTHILNEIRNQNISESTFSALEEKLREYQPGEASHKTRLFTHNADVDALNERFIRELSTKEKVFKAKKEGNKSVLEKYESYALLSFELMLKIGARVMFIKNHQEGQYMNGTVGTIKDFSKDGFPIVETTTGDEIEAKPETWSVENEIGDVIATIKQVPLKLAWAVTIHKSQGMTLDQAEIDLTKTFEPGQGYVALSRLKDLAGLELKGINNTAFQLDKLAFKADVRFQELSKEAETMYDDEQFERLRKAFITQSGGILQGFTRKKKTPADAKKKAPSTYYKTKELLNEGKTIAEIADIRKMSKATIGGHVQKLKADGEELKLDHLKPDQQLIELVNESVVKIYPKKEDRKQLKLKEIFEDLGEEIPYEQIRLALLFIEL